MARPSPGVLPQGPGWGWGRVPARPGSDFLPPRPPPPPPPGSASPRPQQCPPSGNHAHRRPGPSRPSGGHAQRRPSPRSARPRGHAHCRPGFASPRPQQCPPRGNHAHRRPGPYRPSRGHAQRRPAPSSARPAETTPAAALVRPAQAEDTPSAAPPPAMLEPRRGRAPPTWASLTLCPRQGFLPRPVWPQRPRCPSPTHSAPPHAGTGTPAPRDSLALGLLDPEPSPQVPRRPWWPDGLPDAWNLKSQA
ncbi:proline-rich protein 2-like [Choloepus didactylus]|uniref:proline-rich protein 2-like n=1 Tax=Choloepus didactylus TaxID=27675 RepID=UPI00189D5DA3|nr:proline-rich protein 2-like [Choloepus didactylus]